MAHIGMPVLKKATAIDNCLINGVAGDGCPNGLITCTQALGNGNNIGDNRILLTSKSSARAPHSGHHLIENEQYTMLIANFTNLCKIRLCRRQDTRGGTTNRDRKSTRLNSSHVAIS